MRTFLQQLFNRRKPCLTAIDIGSHHMKAIEMKMFKGFPRITALGSMPTPPSGEGQGDEENLARAISRLVETAGITGKEVITSLPAARVMTRQLKLPSLNDEELVKAVHREAKEHIPLPVEDLTIRYVKLGEETLDGLRFINLLLVAVPTSLVEQYYHIFMMAGLRVVGMDLQAFGLWRLFGRMEGCPATLEENPAALGILEIGAAGSQLVIVKNREIKFTGLIEVGGDAITESIAQNYRISREEARQLKEEWGRVHSGEEEGSGASFPVKLQLDFYIREGIDNLAREVQRSLGFYGSLGDSVPVSKIFLAGGASKLPGLSGYLTEKSGIDTEVSPPDCWKSFGSRDAFPYDPAYAVALGLVMGEADVRCTK